MPRKLNDKFGDRPGRQSSEGYDTVKTDMPADRFQESKQVLTPDQLGGADSPVAGSANGDTKGNAAIKLKSKLKVAPDSSVDMLEGKQVGGIPLEAAAVTRSAAGASAQSPAEDTSRIPYRERGYRPDTRYGKKRSEDLFELDNTVSEQIAPVVEESKDLREAPDAKQGYNGRKQFTQTRGKKNFIAEPGALLFDASADFDVKSHVIHTTGQILEGYDHQAGYPTVSESGAMGENETLKKGNYLLRSMDITVQDGHITGISFNEDRIKSNTDSLSKDEANFNWQIDQNNVAKSVLRMQTELGRETTDKWSPLAYVIDQPYEYNMLLHDIEATTGALAATAYRAAVASLSFQRNIVSKDGIGPQASAIRMFLENIGGPMAYSETLPSLQFNQMLFNRSLYQQGSAAGLIAMFDSTGKYRTKADILGLQRSLPLHLSQADNNLDPLHVKANYLKVLDKVHTFSTITGSYNPMLPIHATRYIKLMNPLSLNYFLQGWKNPNLPVNTVDPDDPAYNPAAFDQADLTNDARDKVTGTLSRYAYQYADIRNRYFTRVQHPFVDGLVLWLLRHEGAFCNTFGNGTTHIPCSFDFMNPGLFQFMICSALQYIALERNVIFRDVLFAGEQSTYIWDDLASLKECDPLHSTQLTIAGYNEPLKLGKLAPDSAVREMWPQTYPLMKIVSRNGATMARQTYALPWHMNERAYTVNGVYTRNRGWKDEATYCNMSWPSIRDEVRHEYVDILTGMDERDARLALDRDVNFISFTSRTGPTHAENVDRGLAHTIEINPTSITAANLNDYVTLRSLRYDLNSDGRMIAEFDMSTGTEVGSERNIDPLVELCLPKELGWIFAYPSQLMSPITAITYDADTGAVTIGHAYDVATLGTFAGGAAHEIRSYRVNADANTNGSIDRSAALTQAFRTAYADRRAYALNQAYTAWTGIALSSSYNNNAPVGASAIYTLRGETNGQAGQLPSGLYLINTNGRFFWSMLQRYFRPVNDFENCYIAPTGTDLCVNDPLEEAIYFGFCGMLASDYTQDVLERLAAFDQLGLDYTEDVFTKESLIFRV